jgi:GTPase
VVLVGVGCKAARSDWPIEDSLQELSHLARAAGASVVAIISQKLDSPSSTYYVGRGKLAELSDLKRRIGYDTVIFDDELSPHQQRNLEEVLAVKVVDRTALILDVFARKARTREGQLQVELAQHRYLLPRLVGQWSHLEKLGGGIGTRGPGESQLETDRRLIRKRIVHIEREIDHVRQQRTLYRKRRQKAGLYVVSLVGYTNAGKSTLFNYLSHAEVGVEDKLFSTLDPITRSMLLPGGQKILFTDTVGFIHKLPPSIVAAFRATLEELDDADLLLHVIDVMHKNAAAQCRTVEKQLEELGLQSKARITVINKLDLALRSQEDLQSLTDVSCLDERFLGYGGDVALVSAAKGWGISSLLDKIAYNLPKQKQNLPEYN